MGFESLRNGQKEIIDMIMAERDILCILPTGGGKCLAKDTPVRMFDGTIKMSQDIIPGDKLLGPDGLARIVTSICKGREEMFRITPHSGGDPYTVNRSHILSLLETSIVDGESQKAVNMGVVEYLSMWSWERKRYLGWRGKDGDILSSYKFRISSVGVDDYYGFELEGPDKLFLLGDFTVTHNTACFVLPALACNWPTIIFSPLTALMRDQVQSLQRVGIAAGELSGLKSVQENQMTMEQWAMGELQFLYAAPERMSNPKFMELMQIRKPYLLVVDESHCLSTWGDSFREHYKFLGDFVRDVNPQVVAAFSATVPDDAEAEIREVLGIKQAARMEFYNRRSNLILSSEVYPGDDAFVGYVVNTKGAAVVYCTSIKRVEQYASLISAATDDLVAVYHGDMDPTAKRTNMDMFMKGTARIVVATNAFGMGIDHPRIRNVIHRDIPKSSEALSQEIGRGGRDGNTSWCKMFYSDKSLDTAKFFVKCENPTEGDVKSVFRALETLSSVTPNILISQMALGQMCGLHDASIPAVLTRLKAAKVIERSTERPTIAGADFIAGFPHVPKTFAETRDAVYANVLETKGDTLMFDILTVAEELGVADKTLRGRFSSYHKDGYMKYYPPFRGAPMRIVGSIQQVDFNKLRSQATVSEEKLQQVLDYHATPDNEKHAFLETLFGSKK